MKADHRKQPQRNELASWLQRQWEGVGAGNLSNTFWIAIGVIALAVVLYLAWKYFSNSTTTNKAAVWRELENTTKPEDLEAIINQNRGTSLGRVAKLQLARIVLNEGFGKLGSDFKRTEGITEVEKGRTLFTELIAEAKDDAPILREALLAAARAEESLVGIPKADNASEARGSLDRALEFYDRVASDFKDSAQGKDGEARAKSIRENKAKIQQFYDDLNRRFIKLDAPTPPLVPPSFGEPRPMNPPISIPPLPPLENEPKPIEPKPMGTLPPPPTSPPKPGDPKPMETKPLPPPPMNPKPPEVKPGDPKPGDTKPLPPPVVKPAEPKPGDTKPMPPPKTDPPKSDTPKK